MPVTSKSYFGKVFPVILLFGFWISPHAHAQQISLDSLGKNPKLFLQVAINYLRWTDPAEPEHIVGPIYFVGTKGLASYLFHTTQGLILLNTGMPGSGPMIEASVRKLGFNPEDIKYILSWHAHIDHTGGHAYMQKISGAKVAIMAEEKELLESGGKTDFQYEKFPEMRFDPVQADIILKDGDIITLGDVALEVLFTPGHTKGSNTWVTNVVDSGKMYTVVFPDGTSINPGYRIVKDPSYPGIENDYRNTLNTLEKLKPDIWLSGHNEFFNFESKRKRAMTEGVKAWVDPEGYRLRIAGERAKLEAQINKELGAR